MSFNPADWTSWAVRLIDSQRVGGVWAAPGPGFIVRKDGDAEVTVLYGRLDDRTAAVFAEAGITVNVLYPTH